MANPLYNPQQNNPYANIIRQAEEMKKTLQGNPKDIVVQLLNSGRMSQTQFNALSQKANQIVEFMNI